MLMAAVWLYSMALKSVPIVEYRLDRVLIACRNRFQQTLPARVTIQSMRRSEISPRGSFVKKLTTQFAPVFLGGYSSV
jgi:hypothetical protein